MATTTPKIGLRQPAGTDYVQVLQDISNNMGKLDTAVGAINSNINVTNDILESALSVDRSTFFNGSGSAYTGVMPVPNVRYGVFHVDVRGTRKFVTGVGTGGEIVVNTYDGTSWSGWKEASFNTSGTWTPNIQRATASTALGKYQRIGNLYICSFYFDITAVESSAPYINGGSLPGYTSSVIWSIAGTWSSTANEFGTVGNTSNNNVWFAKNGQMYGLSGCVGKAVRGTLTYIV